MIAEFAWECLTLGGRIRGRKGRKMTVGVNGACCYHNNTSYIIGISLVLYLFDTPLCAHNVIIHIKINVALHESGSWIWRDANDDAVWNYWQTQAVWRYNWWPSLKITWLFSSQWEFNGWTSEEVSLHIELHKASLYWFAWTVLAISISIKVYFFFLEAEGWEELKYPDFSRKTRQQQCKEHRHTPPPAPLYYHNYQSGSHVGAT